MENRKVAERMMHFFAHNSIMITVIVMGLVHAGLLAIMIYAKVKPLITFNIFSVVVYGFCALLCKAGYIFPIYASILLEVSFYTATAIKYIGWDSGSCCFLFSIVPIIVYIGSYLFKGTKRYLIVVVLFLDFLIYSLAYIGYSKVEPIYKLPETVNTVMLLFASFAMFFAMVFYSAIYIYTSEANVSYLKSENIQLSTDAKEDPLTDLLNRRGFLPIVESYMKDKKQAHFCIAFCDIDNFKRLNDSYGHDCGDEVLRHISRLIKKEMYGCPICRWGGEEMVILMKDYDFTVAKQKMEYIRGLIETSPTIFYNKHIPTTLTIGVEEYKESYRTPDEIIKVADTRMYRGKQQGKNIVISDDPEESNKSRENEDSQL